MQDLKKRGGKKAHREDSNTGKQRRTKTENPMENTAGKEQENNKRNQ